uniref:glucan endo-1,3-beta-D-glucosidase n=1 Tax=Tanacetum cinerariifolium TaxID=118510 RepID=A0A6L2N6C1_TANCI|nr:glycoside hydrolase, catalytic domain-containing protein [Tanacetum cinerariifolium]
MNILNGSCNNCIYEYGKPVTCGACEGMLRGGFCLHCNLKADNCYQNAYSFDDALNNSNYLSQPQYENYLCNLCGNNSHDGYDCQQQFLLVYEQELSYNQNYHEYGNPPSKDHPIFNNDEEHFDQNKEHLENSSNEIAASNSNQEKEKLSQDSDIHKLIREECCVEEVKNVVEQPAERKTRTIESLQNFRVIHKSSISLNNTSQASPVHTIAPILSTKEPKYSTSMGEEHPNTTLETESDKIIKSGVEKLVPILSENEVTLEDKREGDVPVCENSPICDNHSDIFPDSKNDDDISSDDDDFEDIEYVEASLSNPEIVSIAEENVNFKDISQIQDVILCEKLLSMNRLIANIESLNDNPTPDLALNSSVSFPISKESDNSLSDNFSPEFETFCDHTEETRSGNTTTHANDSLPECDSFCFKIEPDQEKLINVVKNDIPDDSTNDPLLEEADLFLDFDNSIPPGIKNFGENPEGDICFLEALLSDDSIPFPNNESSESDFDNPPVPQPPQEQPDADFEPDSGDEISVVMKNNNKLECLNPRDEFDDDYFSFMFVIYSKMFLSFLFAESEDTIFEPGIAIYRFYSFLFVQAGFISSDYPDCEVSRALSFCKRASHPQLYFGNPKGGVWANIICFCSDLNKLGISLSNLMVNKVSCGIWAWKRQPSGRALEELSSLSCLINMLVLDMSREDNWSWSLDETGSFSLRLLYTESKLGQEGAPVADPTLYRSLGGALQYLTFTRPDLSYVVQQLCLYMHDPREPHLLALKRILRYVRGTLDHGLQLHASSMTQLVAYIDADWTGCPFTRRSTSGYCVFFGDNIYLGPQNDRALADQDAFIGVNIGTALSDMPNPTQTAVLLKSQNIRHVRLYDADQAMLMALADTGIQVTVSVPNQQLLAIAQSNTTAANWVSRNILPHISTTNITAISVGNEVLTTTPNVATVLVTALKYIHFALVSLGLDSQIKVSTTHSSNIVLDAFPPSQAFFNKTWDPVMIPLLEFLQSTGSYLMINLYPYYDYMQSNGAIPLDYALFRPLPEDKEAVDLNTLLHYTNVFDAVVDATYFAMMYLNYTNIPIVVTESGWPSKGDSSEPDATLDNANTYNSNLIKHVLNNTGTPKHPGVGISTYIYELYNEDSRPGSVSEKNWGLFDANGRPIYTLNLMDSGSVLVNDTTGQTYCVVKKDADTKMVQAALDWACGPGKVNCSMMLQGEPCYQPDTMVAHATYAFDTYYQQMDKAEGTCDFNGVATITTRDPSLGDCILPRSGTGSNGTTTNNGPSLAPSTNSTTSGGVLISDSVSISRLVAFFCPDFALSDIYGKVHLR